MNLREFQGKHPQIGAETFIDPSAVVIGDVELGRDCSVWPGTIIRGDMHRIRIGDRCSIQDGSVLHITHAGPFTRDGHPLIIGNDVTVGHRAVLHGCTLGDEILVGMGAIIMDGAVVPSRVVIGANSLVPPGKELDSDSLYVGSPAQRVRALSASETEYFKYTAANYVRLKDQYLAETPSFG
ncbi:gamma carbonic anhydrase family protein [Allohahella marinimesophila]|uniref:Gamma carbonic anhydrase family protein n=1 Tax=Allohahella marinimesophila TaxID=1054972 RepID=A0ABP7PCP2_9GAMM